MIFISTVFLRPRNQAPLPPLLRYEVLIPYNDVIESRRKGLPEDTRYSWLVEVWATDPAMAKKCAFERFLDYKFHAPTARLAPGGPVALRIVRPQSQSAT